MKGHRCTRSAIVALAAMTAALHTAEGAIYRWVDGDGRVQYSATMPPSQARPDYTVHDKEGRQLDAVAAPMTAEQLAAARREAARKEEQARRDHVLLQTFGSEEDIKHALDERIAPLNSALTIAHVQLAKQQLRLAELELQSGSQETQPDDLVSARDNLRASITATQTEIESKEDEKRAIEAVFAADMARYRELKANR